MSRIDDLIAKLCPNGVEYKTLGDICNIETGKLNANDAVENGAFMFFTTAKKPSKIDKYRWDTEALLISGNANVGEVKHYIGKFDVSPQPVFRSFLRGEKRTGTLLPASGGTE